MSDSPSITPTTATAPGSPISLEILTPRIDALRSSMGKDFDKSASRRAARKNSTEDNDRVMRKAMVEGLITARRAEKPGRRSSLDQSGGSKRAIAGYVSLDDFESFKRTIEARMQSMEEALEQKDDEITALQAAISTKSGEKKSTPKQNTTPSKPMSAVPSLNLGAPSSPGSKGNKNRPAMSPLASSSKGASEAEATTFWKGEQWESKDIQHFLSQLGVFKLWTASMVCKPWKDTACNVVLPQKRTQLRTGADAAIDFHAANVDDTKGCQELLPPLFQAGGPYHTLGVAGFIRLQETLKNDTVQLKDFYKCLRDLTRKK